MGKMTISVISNGFGEDQIAAHLVSELIKVFPSAAVSLFPLVGEGLEYKKRGWTPVLENPTFPSGGFIRTFNDFWKDCKAGLLTHFFKQRALIKSSVSRASLTICVGDVFCLMMGSGSRIGPVVFLPTAKSDLFMKHSWIEMMLIRRCSTVVFTRDQYTADSLKKEGLPSLFLGSPMTDLPQGSDFNLGFLDSDEVIGLLPGSREEAYGNSQKIVDVVSHFQNEKYVLAKADSVSLDRLAIESKLTIVQDSGKTWLCNDSIKILVWSCFEDVLNQSSWFIGLAGTANEQAVYRGKVVFTFEGTGPQSTRQRFEEQRLLLGDQLVVIDDQDSSKIATTIKAHSKLKRAWEKTSAAKDIVDYIRKTFF